MNYSFGKKNCAELVITRGAAGEWLITDEFSTDLDEIGIFVLSKDQTFRICATFLDPAKFSILVIHLHPSKSFRNILHNFSSKLKFFTNQNFLYFLFWLWSDVWIFCEVILALFNLTDIVLLSHKLRDIQAMINNLVEESQKVGLRVNIEKTKDLRVNNRTKLGKKRLNL
jgi:hypothetical protein